MRVGLTFEQDSQAMASRMKTLLQSTSCSVVCIGCAKNLVDKLAAGDRYDLIADCCADHSKNSPAILALADLYDMPSLSALQLVSSLESGNRLDEILQSAKPASRRPHMLQRATTATSTTATSTTTAASH